MGIFDPKVESPNLLTPSIEEQGAARIQGDVQALQAKEKLAQIINTPAPFLKGSEKELFPPMAAPVELPDPMEFRMAMSPTTNHISGSDVVNFLFGDEMGVLGMKMDNEGFHWEWEIAKDQWANEPLWVNLLATTSLVGSSLFPAAKAAHSSYKYGRIASKLGGVNKRREELTKFKELGMIDDFRGVSESTIKTLRMQENQLASYNKMSAMIDAEAKGELSVSGWEKAKWEFNKRFANQYFRLTNSLVENNGVMDQYKASLDNLWKSEDMGRVMATVPDISEGEDVYKYWMHQQRPDLIPNSPKLKPETQKWADYMGEKYRESQNHVIEIGLVPESVRDRIGDMHLPAQFKGTPMPDADMSRTMFMPVRSMKEEKAAKVLVGKDVPRKGLDKALFGDTKHVVEEAKTGPDSRIALSTYKFPRLDSHTLKRRNMELPEVAQRLENGELITDQAELTVRGYMMDRMLTHNFEFVRDIAMNDSYAVPHRDIAKLYGGDVAKAAEAGYVSLDDVPTGARDALKRMLGKKGVRLGDNEELPWIKKAIFDEVFGEQGAFSQVQAASDLMEVITTMFKTSKTAFSVPTQFQNIGGNLVLMAQAGVNPLDPDVLDLSIGSINAFKKISAYHAAAKKAGGKNTREILDAAKINLGKMKINGKNIDMNELLDPGVRELIEEGAMDMVEGSGHLEDLYKNLRKEQHLTRGAIKAYQKMKNIAQVGDKVKWMDEMTKWYLAGDMVPKMTMYLYHRGQGLSKSSAMLEVGRRLPMYGTVGSAIKRGRKWAFPWATFPAEAMRITKNNIMDHPLRMMPWLHMTNITQAMFSGVGLGPQTPEQAKEAKQSLPLWAQRSATVAMSGEGAAGMGGAMTGAMVGGTAGLLKGSPMGALAGAAIGGIAGAAGMSAITSEKDGDSLRGMVMDWLPHSSFMLTSNSPDMMGQYTPFKDLQGAMEQMPVEPFAILKPMVEVMSGKTGFGTEIGSEGPGDAMGKMLAGMIGIIAPPWIQKYGFKATTPDVSLSEHLTGTPLTGDITNVSRLLVDTGIAIDPNTGKTGSLSHDFLLKNLGMGKSWGATGPVALSNETETEKHMGQVRNHLSKQLSYYSANGKEDRMMKVLTDVMSTFSKQYADNPARAHQKYGEWVESKLDQIGQFPRLRGWSQEEMRERLAKSVEFGAQSRGQARQEIINTLQNQLMLKRAANSSSSNKRGRKTGRDRGERRGR